MKKPLTFQEFLERGGLRISEEEKAKISRLVANDLAVFLRRWLDPNFGDVCGEKYDRHSFEAACKKFLDSECKANEPNLSEYKRALDIVKSFLDARKMKSGIGSTGRKHGPRKPSAPATPPVVISVPDLTEGEMKEMHIVHHERNPEARRKCIESYRAKHGGRIVCECCGFDFGKAYGEVGEDFIEVHHLSPISQKDEAYEVNPQTDLVPLCSNCHAMIHRILTKMSTEGPEALTELRRRMESAKEKP